MGTRVTSKLIQADQLSCHFSTRIIRRSTFVMFFSRMHGHERKYRTAISYRTIIVIAASATRDLIQQVKTWTLLDSMWDRARSPVCGTWLEAVAISRTSPGLDHEIGRMRPSCIRTESLLFPLRWIAHSKSMAPSFLFPYQDSHSIDFKVDPRASKNHRDPNCEKLPPRTHGEGDCQYADSHNQD